MNSISKCSEEIYELTKILMVTNKQLIKKLKSITNQNKANIRMELNAEKIQPTIIKMNRFNIYGTKSVKKKAGDK